MSQELLIFIIVLSVLIGVLLIVDTLIMINVIRLKKRLKKRQITINSLMAQHYDLTVILGDKMLKAGYKLPEELLISLNLHEKKEMMKLSTVERLKMKTIITDTAGALFLLLETSKISTPEEIDSLHRSMLEFNHRYRQEIVLYNQDIYAYNYWIHFWSFRLISLIFHWHKREPLQ